MSKEAVSLLYQSMCIFLVFLLASISISVIVPVRRWVDDNPVNHAVAMFLASLIAAYINKVAL